MNNSLQTAFESFLAQYDCQWADEVHDLVEAAFLAGWLAAGGKVPENRTWCEY